MEKHYIKKLKEGSPKALDFFYTLYASRLYSYCYAYTKSQEDAEELVQDTFVRLWLYRDKIRKDDTLIYFIFKIAKTQLIDRFRSRINSPRFHEYLEYCDHAEFSEDEVSGKIEFDEFMEMINTTKSHLSVTQRKVFELSREYDLSNREIASRLNLSEQTVKNQLSIALKVMREKLTPHLKSGMLFLLFDYLWMD